MTKVITRADVKRNRHRNNLWLIIHDDVYDVTKFLEEHPGGEDTLLDAAGSDATQAFEDVGHSEDARELLKQYKIGTLPDDEKSDKEPVQTCCKSTSQRNIPSCTKVCTPVDRKGSCSECNSVASCLEANKPPTKKTGKFWRNFDAPTDSALTPKSSKRTRLVPDKCDEGPTSTSAVTKVVADNDSIPQTKKKKSRCDKRRKRGLPCDRCDESNWKWIALAALILGAIAVGAIVVKKNS